MTLCATLLGADGGVPWDTINRAPRPADFGFPHCYVNQDSELNASRAAHLESDGHARGYEDAAPPSEQVAWCQESFARGVAIGYHSAPLGVTFFDESRLLVAERGAFGGSTAGHQISTVRADLTQFEPLITGFIHEQTGDRWARPVDVQMEAQPNSEAFFVSDDFGGTILRFEGWAP